MRTGRSPSIPCRFRDSLTTFIARESSTRVVLNVTFTLPTHLQSFAASGHPISSVSRSHSLSPLRSGGSLPQQWTFHSEFKWTRTSTAVCRGQRGYSVSSFYQGLHLSLPGRLAQPRSQ